MCNCDNNSSDIIRAIEQHYLEMERKRQAIDAIKSKPSIKIPEKILVKKLDSGAKLPVKKKKLDVGYDIFSNDEAYIMPGDTKVIPTGLAMKAPDGYYLEIAPRSGHSISHGLVIAGYIESDYTGEIGIIYHNKTLYSQTIAKHKRIARIILRKQYEADLHVVDELPDGERGNKGFGESGED